MTNVYLVGFMASGKSSVGAALAGLLDWQFEDLDARLCRRFDTSIAEVFARVGEATFRAAETEALRATARQTGLVVATGGGAFCCGTNRRIMADAGRTVFLDVPWAVLAGRLAGSEHERPLHRGVDASRRLLERRLPCYLQAEITVSLDGSETPQEAAELVADALGESAGVLGTSGGGRRIEELSCGS